MSAGWFNEGRKWQVDKTWLNLYSGSQVSVGLYTNAIDSLNSRNVLADILACSGVGYAPIVLNAGGWSSEIVLGPQSVDDSVTLTRAATVFSASANWGSITGAYLFLPATGIAIAWKDASGPYNMVNGAQYMTDFISDLFA